MMKKEGVSWIKKGGNSDRKGGYHGYFRGVTRILNFHKPSKIKAFRARNLTKISKISKIFKHCPLHNLEIVRVL